MTITPDTPRDVAVVLLTDVTLRWIAEGPKTATVGQMADRFLSLLDQAGWEIVKKDKKSRAAS